MIYSSDTDTRPTEGLRHFLKKLKQSFEPDKKKCSKPLWTQESVSLVPEFSGGDGCQNVQTLESHIGPPPAPLHSRGHNCCWCYCHSTAAVQWCYCRPSATGAQTSLLICWKKWNWYRSVFRIRDILVRMRMRIRIKIFNDFWDTKKLYFIFFNVLIN